MTIPGGFGNSEHHPALLWHFCNFSTTMFWFYTYRVAETTPVVLLTCLKRPIFGTRRCFVPNTFVLYRPVIDIVQSGARKHANRFRHSRSCGQSNLVAWFLSALCLLKDCLHFYLFCLICRPNRMQWIGYIYHVTNKTRRPASADRTARAANFRRDLEAT